MKGKTKKDLVETIIPHTISILQDNNKIKEIASALKKYNISLGTIVSYLNDGDKLYDVETYEVALFGEQIYLKGNNTSELELSLWFNESEIKEIRQYYKEDIATADKIELPLTFENVAYLGDGVYSVPLDYSVIARMYKYGLLNYNFEIQREGRKVKRGNEVIQKPKLQMKNVNEIKDLLIKKKLKKTALAYNCATDTTDDESGYELLFDEKQNKLTITEGTRIDILDGAHRSRGILEAYNENPNLEGKIVVLFSNYTTAEAKEYQVELAKQTPFNRGRAKELANESMSNEVVKRLNSEGELKNRISSIARLQRSLGEVTSYEILSDAIDKFYSPKKRIEVKDITKTINEYMDYLFGYFDEHLKSENNLLFERTFFRGHILLSKRMKDNNIDFEMLNKVLGEIDFNRSNPMWEKLNILHNGKIDSKKSLRYIEKFFNELKLT